MENVKVTTLPDGRRQFYIDVPDLPSDKAMAFVEEVRKQFAKRGKNHE